MIKANVAEVKARFSHYLRLASSGEEVVVCDRNEPVARIVPLARKVDIARRMSAIGMFEGGMTEAELDEALRPMTDEEAEAFIEGRY